MRTIFSISALSLLLVACATTPTNMRTVWTESTKPPSDLPAAFGFVATPAQAYSAVWDARALSLKHVWHIYADTQYYYVHDTFLGDSPRRAYVQGVRIDGRTGQIVKR